MTCLLPYSVIKKRIFFYYVEIVYSKFSPLLNIILNIQKKWFFNNCFQNNKNNNNNDSNIDNNIGNDNDNGNDNCNDNDNNNGISIG